MKTLRFLLAVAMLTSSVPSFAAPPRPAAPNDSCHWVLVCGTKSKAKRTVKETFASDLYAKAPADGTSFSTHTFCKQKGMGFWKKAALVGIGGAALVIAARQIGHDEIVQQVIVECKTCPKPKCK